MTASALPAARESAPTPSMFERVPCYLCGETCSTPFIEGEDDLTGRPGRFTFVTCSGCGLVYQAPRLTIEHIKGYYDEGYIAHRRAKRWGPLQPLFDAAMNSLDRAKVRIVRRFADLGPATKLLDIGCGAGSFLARVKAQHGCHVAGVDFVDLSGNDSLRGVEFHHGLVYEQELGAKRFDVITMWHFLEHDYDPIRSLRHAASALAPDGRLVIEVPRLDSMSFRMFKDRWPGLQAPQHTVLYDKRTLIAAVEKAGLEVVEHLPYGAFPPYFYLFCGFAFRRLKGRGLDLDRAIWLYFAGQVLLLPLVLCLKHMNFAMQTVVCRKRRDGV